MAFAAPRNKQKAKPKGRNPSDKDLAVDAAEHKSHGPRRIESRYMLDATRPPRNEESHKETSRGSKRPASSPDTSKEDQYGLLETRVLQRALTCQTAASNIAKIRLSAESQLEARWQAQVKNEQAALRVAHLNELRLLSMDDLRKLDQAIIRIHDIEQDIASHTALLEVWQLNINSPMHQSWFDDNKDLSMQCRAAEENLQALLERHPERTSGVVGGLTHDLLASITEFSKVLKLQERLARQSWDKRRRDITLEYERVMLTLEPRAESFVWSCF